jgi:hypothetical protein
MRLTKPFLTAACLLFASIQMATPALADDADAIPANPEISAFGEQVTDADLSTYRGGSALQYNEMKLDGRLYDNQAIANVTGSNFVTQDAFSGASGFSTVVQNSGNNVIIQNATILNISLH